MYKIVGLSMVILIMLGINLVHADTNEQYCALMYSLYGCCSPELVSNYLEKINEPYKAPRVIKQVNPPIAIASPLNVSISTKPLAKVEPNVRYLWYWNNKEWVRARLIG